MFSTDCYEVISVTAWTVVIKFIEDLASLDFPNISSSRLRKQLENMNFAGYQTPLASIVLSQPLINKLSEEWFCFCRRKNTKKTDLQTALINACSWENSPHSKNILTHIWIFLLFSCPNFFGPGQVPLSVAGSRISAAVTWTPSQPSSTPSSPSTSWFFWPSLDSAWQVGCAFMFCH